MTGAVEILEGDGVRHELWRHMNGKSAYRANAADRATTARTNFFFVLDGMAKERGFAAVFTE